MQKDSFFDEEIKEYYNYVKKTKIVNRNELNNLLISSSKAKFIKAYLYHVFIYAYQIYSHVTKQIEVDYPFIDFIQEGNLLLIEMVNNNKYTKDIKTFSLYYWYHLKRVLDNIILPRSKAVNLESYLKVLYFKDELYKILKHEPTIDELISFTSYKKHIIVHSLAPKDMLISPFDISTLDTYLEPVEFESEVVSNLSINTIKEVVLECIEFLSEDKKELIFEIYGLNGHHIKTLRQIAKEKGVSIQYISKTNQVLLQKIKRRNFRLLKEYRENNY